MRALEARGVGELTGNKGGLNLRVIRDVTADGQRFMAFAREIFRCGLDFLFIPVGQHYGSPASAKASPLPDGAPTQRP